jgi:hypothetical protein
LDLVAEPRSAYRVCNEPQQENSVLFDQFTNFEGVFRLDTGAEAIEKTVKKLDLLQPSKHLPCIEAENQSIFATSPFKSVILRPAFWERRDTVTLDLAI